MRLAVVLQKEPLFIQRTFPESNNLISGTGEYLHFACVLFCSKAKCRGFGKADFMGRNYYKDTQFTLSQAFVFSLHASAVCSSAYSHSRTEIIPKR
jgi:hypothetical protein